MILKATRDLTILQVDATFVKSVPSSNSMKMTGAASLPKVSNHSFGFKLASRFPRVVSQLIARRSSED
jgi:hypothetical protein